MITIYSEINISSIELSDIGTIDEEGYIRICARIKEMIIRGGENIYPREIEEFILTNPVVADVHVCLLMTASHRLTAYHL